MRIRTLFLVIALAASLPICLLTIYIIHQMGQERQNSELLHLQRRTDAAAAAINQLFSNGEEALRALSHDDNLEAGDIAQFYELCRHFVDASLKWNSLALVAGPDRLAFTTARPFGTALPRPADSEGIQRALARDRLGYSNLFVGTVQQQHLFSIDLPLPVDLRGQRYVLRLVNRPEIIAAILAEQNFPADWVAGVVDAAGTVVTRSRNPDLAVGQPVNPNLSDLIYTPEWEGQLIERTNREGEEVVTTFRQLRAPGWMLTVAMPKAALAAYTTQFYALAAGASAFVLLIAVLAGWSAAHALEVRFSQVAAEAEGIGLPGYSHMPTGVQELDGLGEQMATAHQLVVDRETEINVQRDAALAAWRHEAALRAELEQSRARLQMAMRNATMGTWTYFPKDDRLISCSVVKAIYGHPPDFDFTYRHAVDAAHPEDRDGFVAAVAAARASAGSFHNERRIVAADGTLRWLATDGRWVEGSEEEGPVLVGVCRDITEDKRKESQLQQAIVAAERANDAKSRFLAAASHDLRQPLQALSLYHGVLRQSATEGQDKLMGHIDVCLGSLNELLADLLDLSKLDAGVVVPAVSTFALGDLVHRVVLAHRPEAARKGLSLRAVATAAEVGTDPVILERLVGNLVANAVRYTRDGGIVIGCRRRGGRLWLDVTDSGIGIPADKLNDIFQAFHQLGNAERNREKGSGLGLAIVRKMAALLGLEVAVRSRLGHGSTFSVSLPPAAAPCAPVPVRPAMVRQLRIALVEDDANVREALALALALAGHTVSAAACPLELAPAFAEGGRPDVVLADYSLANGRTGLDAIGWLRERFGADIGAIVLTGETTPAVVRAITERQIQICHKPVNYDQLNARLAEIVGAA